MLNEGSHRLVYIAVTVVYTVVFIGIWLLWRDVTSRGALVALNG